MFAGTVTATTAYEHAERQLASEMQVFVATDAPVKCILITLRNLSDRPRRISVTGYCEWVLGERRERQAMHIVTRLDAQTGAVFAGNAFNFDFPDRVAFFQCSERTARSRAIGPSSWAVTGRPPPGGAAAARRSATPSARAWTRAPPSKAG